MMRSLISSVVIFIIGAGLARAAEPVDEFKAARDLYAAADYDGALAILNRLDKAPAASADPVRISEYRALCYLAVGDTTHAQQALATIITVNPLYRPAGASPRLESAFGEVRRRVLPDVVRSRFAAAKTAYDRHDFDTAAAGFRDVMALLDDPDLASAPQPSLSDLRLLANGFLALAVDAAAPAAPRPVATSAPPAGFRVPPPGQDRIYSATDADVVAPVVIKETWPSYTGSLPRRVTGAMQITIGVDGRVIDATMRIRTKTMYDAVAIAATRRWQYKPALLAGHPVKYTKIVYVNIAPQS